MPTPAGKPRVGERVRWRDPSWSLHPETANIWYYGKVLIRTDGIGWAVQIQPDDERCRTFWYLSAGYHLRNKSFEVVTP